MSALRGPATVLALALLACAGPGRVGAPTAPGARIEVFDALAPGPPAAPSHVVLVSVAGLTPAHYLAPDAPMPLLAAAARAGIAAERVVPVAPATPYPVHTTWVTGRSPRDHGVPADHPLGERGVRGQPAAHASAIRVPTLWQQVAEAGGAVAALDWPVTLGAAIPLLVPDVEVTARGPDWRAQLADAAAPRLAALAAADGGDLDVPGPDRDAFLVGAACSLLAQEGPRLLLLRLSQTAPVLARYGPWAAETRAAFASADGSLRRLVDCLGGAGRLESTALVVVGDRGWQPVHTALRPNAVLAAAGLVALGPRGEAPAWRALARSNGGSAFVYAASADDAVRARDVLAAEAERTGGFRVVSAREMIERQADPEAWFGLEAQPGFVFLDALRGPEASPAPVRGAGGYLDPAADASPGFVAFGRGLRRGLRVPSMSQLDVAPTLARLLGSQLPEPSGHVLAGLLRLPGDVAAAPAQALEPGEARWSVEVNRAP